MLLKASGLVLLQHTRRIPGGHRQRSTHCEFSEVLIEYSQAHGLKTLAGLTDMWSYDQPKWLILAGIKYRWRWQTASTISEASHVLIPAV